jgi:hypothetical protein
VTTTSAHDAYDGSDRRMLLGVVASVLVLALLLAGLGQVALTRFGVFGEPGVTVLGTTRLSDPIEFGDAGCLFTFRVAHVPTSASGYAVRVGAIEPVVSSRATMDATGWTTELHLER